MTRPKNSSRAVYSTELGRLCPQCHRRVKDCVCGADRRVAAADGIVRLSRQTRGRAGKAVTVITGLPLAEPQLRALARELKQKCGVGGAIKAANIEIQGDQRQMLQSELEKRG
ncbi:MAG: hypothetical protein KDI01_09975, partial [Halioglobus sp.]|nr:hypothetical protein [Halioglobus sp.]